MIDYKRRIIDFIEGTYAPEDFYAYLESDRHVLDWLQSIIPQDKAFEDELQVKIDYFLDGISHSKRQEIYESYNQLCKITDVERAKKLVDLLNGSDAGSVPFTDTMSLLLCNYKKVLDAPDSYKSSYVQEICTSVKEFFEEDHFVLRQVPYDVKKMYSCNKTSSKLWTCVNIQSWLYGLMTEIYPDETILKSESLYEKASFIDEVCPEYIEGHEIDENNIIEKIVEQAPESLPKAKRKKLIRELIKKEFHIEGTKHPRWIQGGEWPVSKSGKPMRFVEQKRKIGKGYENILYTVYIFEDVDTLQIRTVEQFT